MENLSNRFVSRIKSLITFSKSGLRIDQAGDGVDFGGFYGLDGGPEVSDVIHMQSKQSDL